MDKTKMLMTKYLQVLGGAVGRESDNIRAKMAWSLAEDFLLAQPSMPASLEEFATALDGMLAKEFPFCTGLELNEGAPDGISVVVRDCLLKDANEGLLEKHSLDLCPIVPFFIFVFSRSFSQNAWLLDRQAKDRGCVMNFSLSNHCSCRCE